MNHKIQAITNFEKGYNCAQAVACAYADDLGIDEELLFRLTEGFGEHPVISSVNTHIAIHKYFFISLPPIIR